ncbi:lysosomal amino acid transporter 1 homolog [Hyla sarda]|uniref:lysosomal amino acid transporter 1 homolog n=1 Tax=Hyla sarda TaxID=327740 RepID=UPI0024C22519|nr:lysosomal amino acid transporter 1 homolog [Hyla sarda]XP_056398018.1 lysosomal amino acid transporter 1 homolog [Hyla sarda]
MWGLHYSWGQGGPSPPKNFSDCPNGTSWVWNVFNECAADGRDLASIYLGLFSIFCFVAASFPQYYQSCKTGNMDRALSIWFLLGWLAGDSCNFVGAFLSHQLPIQTYTAVYYVLADIFMLSLYMYYKYRNRGPSAALSINALCGFALFGSAAFLSGSAPAAGDVSTVVSARRLLSAEDSHSEPFSTQEIIGFTIGSVSSMFYLCSRLPQIVTNFRRRSTEGLALSLFFMVILGNLTYGLSVLLKNPDRDQSEADYIEHHLPWLIGSLGVMSLDLVIIFQFFVFSAKGSTNAEAEEQEPLMHSA